MSSPKREEEINLYLLEQSLSIRSRKMKLIISGEKQTENKNNRTETILSIMAIKRNARVEMTVGERDNLLIFMPNRK